MKKIIYLLTATAISLFYIACKNLSINCPSQELIVECAKETDIDNIKAKIHYIENPNEDCPWRYYEIASVKFENGNFELNQTYFPKTLSDKYLSPFSKELKEIVSDTQAKTISAQIKAYDNNNNVVGNISLFLGNENVNPWYISYVYADRSFTQIGSIQNNEYNCTFEKGWNILYFKFGKIIEYTTTKPIDEKSNWSFQTICPD